MELRRTIRPVHKYDDTDYHDYHQDEVEQRTSPDRPAYRGRVIEYNPNLRPAVFPTIPLDQEVSDSATESVDQLDQPPQYAPFPYQQEKIRNPYRGQQADTVQQPFDFSSFSDPQMFATAITNDRWSRELNKDLMMSPLRMKSNGPGNKTYMRNLKLMDKFDKRTEMDWNIAEMETSDEDEVEVIKHHPKDLAWDCLSIAQRLSMVDAVDEHYNCLDHTLQVLRLSAKQKNGIIAHIEKRNQYIDAGETALKMVRDRASEILLGGNQDEIDWLTNKGGYKKLMEDNVYIAIGKFDYLTSTTSELQLAKRYLVTCGQRAELLDHWVSESSIQIGQASTNLSEPMECPAAFPTLPLDVTGGVQETIDERASVPGQDRVAEVPPHDRGRLENLQTKAPTTTNDQPPIVRFAKPKRIDQARPFSKIVDDKLKRLIQTMPSSNPEDDKSKRIVQAVPPSKPNDDKHSQGSELWHGHGHGMSATPTLASNLTLPPQLSQNPSWAGARSSIPVPAMSNRAAMQDKPTNIFSTMKKLPVIDPALENRKQSLPANMPPPPKPTTAKLPTINTAISHHGADVHTPGTKRAAQQYGQADLLSPGTARISPPRKRSAPGPVDGDYAPTKKVKRTYNRRQSAA